MRKDFDESVLRMRITKARESKGINQAQLAEKAGVTPAAISQIEKGNRVPSIPVLHRIASVLEVSLDYLMGKTDKSEIEDLLQSGDIKTFFRGFASLSSQDKEDTMKGDLMENVSITIPVSLLEIADEFCRRSDLTRSQMVGRAIRLYLGTKISRHPLFWKELSAGFEAEGKIKYLE